ncbi:MAG: PKD domain-containing protein, partial [Chloroflexota bacterium]
MAQVFISFKAVDRTTAAEFARALKARGHTVIGDMIDTRGAARPAAQIAARMRGCDFVVLLFDPAAVRDPALVRRVKAARKLGLRVVRVMLAALPAGVALPSGVVDASEDVRLAIAQVVSLADGPPASPGFFTRPRLLMIAAAVVVFLGLALLLFTIDSEGRLRFRLTPTDRISRVAESATEMPEESVSPLPTIPKTPVVGLNDAEKDDEATEEPTEGVEPVTADDGEATGEPTEDLEPVIADFLADPLDGPAPLAVTIENFSSGPIEAYAWDFDGDGTVDSEEETPPPYIYTDPGDYELSLTVTGSDGQTDSYTEYIFVDEPLDGDRAARSNGGSGNDPTPPGVIVDFAANPQSGEAPLIVTFTNQSTGPIVSYEWDFNGDGVTDSSDINPAPYTYTIAGEFRAALTATTEDGQRYTSRTMIYVDPPIEPLAIFEVNPDFGMAPLTANFENLSEGYITAYAWDFDGDGVTDSTAETPPPYTFTEPGEYAITLTVSGPGGTSDPEVMYVVVESLDAPQAMFSVNPSFGYAPLTVNFEDLSDGEITSYAWDFNGDGVTDSTARNPQHTFNQPGEHEITLRVTGPGGTSQPESMYVTALRLDPPVAQFRATPASGSAPLTVSFANQSYGDITSYAWDFNNDGAPDSTVRTPQPYTFNQPGEYPVRLIVTGPGGTSDPYTETIIVSAPDSPEPPVASFTATPLNGTAPLTVSFSDTSTGDIDTRTWDFDGDGVADTPTVDPNTGAISYTYTEPGDYDATLTVVGPGGTSDPYTETIIVSAP